MVAAEPRTVPTVARRLGLCRQSVQRTVNLLVAEELLVSHENPDHRRSRLYRLAPLGRLVLDSINGAAVPWHRAVQEEFQDHELRHFSDSLRRLTRLARSHADLQPGGDG